MNHDAELFDILIIPPDGCADMIGPRLFCAHVGGVPWTGDFSIQSELKWLRAIHPIGEGYVHVVRKATS